MATSCFYMSATPPAIAEAALEHYTIGCVILFIADINDRLLPRIGLQQKAL